MGYSLIDLCLVTLDTRCTSDVWIVVQDIDVTRWTEYGAHILDTHTLISMLMDGFCDVCMYGLDSTIQVTGDKGSQNLYKYSTTCTEHEWQA